MGFFDLKTEENTSTDATTEMANNAEVRNQMSSLVAQQAKTLCLPMDPLIESWRC